MKRAKIRRIGLPEHINWDLEGTDEQIAAHIEKNKHLFGKPQREVTAQEEDVSGAISQREVEVSPAIPDSSYWDQEEQKEIFLPGRPAVTQTLYTLPAEYEIVIEDMTPEIEAKKQKDAEERLNEGLRKAAKDRSLAFDLGKIKDPDTRAFLTDLKIWLSKYQ